jgi:hypothetical protein
MTLTLPDWLPWWVPTVLLVPALLYALLLLAMPFSVFGLKTRLESIDARLDELQSELRMLTPGPMEEPERTMVQPQRPPPPAGRQDRGAAADDLPRTVPVRESLDATPRRPTPARPARSEPRLDWPR